MENKTLKYNFDDYLEIQIFFDNNPSKVPYRYFYEEPKEKLEMLYTLINEEYNKGLRAIDVVKNILKKHPDANREYLSTATLYKGGFVDRI